MYFFLDIDGVVTSLRGHRGTMGPGGESNDIDPLSIEIVNQLAEMSGAQIVIISSRRHSSSRAEMEAWLRQGGLRAPLAEDWKVRDNTDDERHERGMPIREWCVTNGVCSPEHIMIFDDADFGYNGGLKERWVQPNYAKGLMMYDFEAAARLLKLPYAALVEARRTLAPLAAKAAVGKPR